MVCHTALIVFIYKRATPRFAHAASLLGIFLKYPQLVAPNMKGLGAALARADLEPDPSADWQLVVEHEW